ncbi:hypothetical protein GCM10010095_83180 [Streptomyces anthocyanicus]|nr:hypothetical protein GCM10010095_83180 [Streptomyces anthocyanicus]
MIDPADPETLTDMIIAAVDGAHLAVAKGRLSHLTDVTDSIGGIVETGCTGVRQTPDRV